ELRIDPEFATLFPPPSDAELALFEASVKKRGFRAPMTVWEEEGLLLDGHIRLKTADKLKMPPPCLDYISLPDRAAAIEWIVANQIERRNLTKDQRSLVRGRLYNSMKKSHGGKRIASDPSSQNENLPKTAEVVADMFNVSASTILRDAAFAT